MQQTKLRSNKSFMRRVCSCACTIALKVKEKSAAFGMSCSYAVYILNCARICDQLAADMHTARKVAQ